MSDKHFRLEIADRVARLTLARPEQMNTMSPAFWRELDTLLASLQRDAPARALVLDATGKHFCAGMSLDAFSSSIALDDSSAAARANIAPMLGDMQRSFDRLAELRMPVLAAIQGGCIGGGVDLTSAPPTCATARATRSSASRRSTSAWQPTSARCSVSRN